MIEEREAEGTADQGAAGLAVAATYVYGNGIDEVLSMRRELPDGGGGTAPADVYYHSDDQGTIWALTGDGGAVLERYDYEDYGRSHVQDPAGVPVAPGSLGEAESVVGNPYRYTGRRFDPESGLYWYRTRYYDPRAGRFTSRDTIGIWGDPANLGNGNTYVGNNPWTWVDPWGEMVGWGWSGPSPYADEPGAGSGGGGGDDWWEKYRERMEGGDSGPSPPAPPTPEDEPGAEDEAASGQEEPPGLGEKMMKAGGGLMLAGATTTQLIPVIIGPDDVAGVGIAIVGGVVIIGGVTILAAQEIIDILGAKPPFTGIPDSIVRGKKQTRRYAGDGFPLTDVDAPHGDHVGDIGGEVHAHDWDRPLSGGAPGNENRSRPRPLEDGDPPPPTGF